MVTLNNARKLFFLGMVQKKYSTNATKGSKNVSFRDDPARTSKPCDWKQQLPDEVETSSSQFELKSDKMEPYM